MSTFQISINQIVSMFAFILIGYVLKKKKVIPDNTSKVISSILVNVCMPALIFMNCASNMTLSKINSQSKIIICGTVVLALGYIIGMSLAKIFSKNDFERRVYTYSFTIPNIGYMGCPLVEAVFGGEMLFNALMFVFPWYIFIYSKGMNMLAPNTKRGIKGVIFQPNIIAIVVGILVGLSGVKLPVAIEKVATSASSCVGPFAMILTGCVLSEKKFISLVKDGRAYAASVIRLLIIPFAAIIIMQRINIDKNIVVAAGAMLAMPLGLNSVVFPEAYGGDGSKGASMALISHTMSLATIPMVFNYLSTIM